jgi:hypothetical protein
MITSGILFRLERPSRRLPDDDLRRRLRLIDCLDRAQATD